MQDATKPSATLFEIAVYFLPSYYTFPLTEETADNNADNQEELNQENDGVEGGVEGEKVHQHAIYQTTT
jgi:hypothetical protein